MKYIVRGRVVRGGGYGRKIGFPTINLSRNGFVRMRKRPPLGIYAGAVCFEVDLSAGAKTRAGIIIGPLDKAGLPKIEAHLIGFKGNLYGRKITLEINKFLRKFKKFKTEKELITHIKKDLKRC